MKIEKFRNIKIAYMRNVGAYGAANKVFMESFKTYLNVHNLFDENTVILGIAMDDPSFTPVDELRYDVGLIIDPNLQIDLAKRNIEDGDYAVFEVEHTEAGVTSFWQQLPLITKDLSIDRNKAIIERYTACKIKNHVCEFCVPLKEQSN